MHAALPPWRLVVLCAFLATLLGATGFSLYNMLPTWRARLAVLAIVLSGAAAAAILLLPN